MHPPFIAVGDAAGTVSVWDVAAATVVARMDATGDEDERSAAADEAGAAEEASAGGGTDRAPDEGGGGPMEELGGAGAGGSKLPRLRGLRRRLSSSDFYSNAAEPQGGSSTPDSVGTGAGSSSAASAGAAATRGSGNDGGVIRLSWLGRRGACLCAVVAPNRVCMWDTTRPAHATSTFHARRLWTREFVDPVLCILEDPFDERRSVVCSTNGWVQFVRDLTTRRPLKETSKYRVTSSSGAPFSAVTFSPHSRDLLLFLLPREIFLFDSVIRQAVGILHTDGADFSRILPCPQTPSQLLCIHEDDSLSVWHTDWPRAGDETTGEIKYECRMTTTLLPRSAATARAGAAGVGDRLLRVTTMPHCDDALVGLTSGGRLVQWQLRLSSVSPRAIDGFGHGPSCALFCSTPEAESGGADAVAIVHSQTFVSGRVTCIAVEPIDAAAGGTKAARRIALGTGGGMVYVVDAWTGSVEVALRVHPCGVRCIAWTDAAKSELLSASSQRLRPAGASAVPASASKYCNRVMWTSLDSGRSRELPWLCGGVPPPVVLRERVRAAAGGHEAGADGDEDSLDELSSDSDDDENVNQRGDVSSAVTSRADAEAVRSIAVSPDSQLAFVVFTSQPPVLLYLRPGRLPRRLPCAGSPVPGCSSLLWLPQAAERDTDSVRAKVLCAAASRGGGGRGAQVRSGATRAVLVVDIAVEFMGQSLRGHRPTTDKDGRPLYLAVSATAVLRCPLKANVPAAVASGDDAREEAAHAHDAITALALKDDQLAVGNASGVIQFFTFDWDAGATGGALSGAAFEGVTSLDVHAGAIRSLAFTPTDGVYQLLALTQEATYCVCDIEGRTVVSSSVEVSAPAARASAWAAENYPVVLGVDGTPRVFDLSLTFSCMPLLRAMLAGSGCTDLLTAADWARLRIATLRPECVRACCGEAAPREGREAELFGVLTSAQRGALLSASATPELLCLASARVFGDADAIRRWSIAAHYLAQFSGAEASPVRLLPSCDLMCSAEDVEATERAILGLRTRQWRSKSAVAQATVSTFSDDEETGTDSSDSDAAGVAESDTAARGSPVPAASDAPSVPVAARETSSSSLVSRFSFRRRSKPSVPPPPPAAPQPQPNPAPRGIVARARQSSASRAERKAERARADVAAREEAVAVQQHSELVHGLVRFGECGRAVDTMLGSTSLVNRHSLSPDARGVGPRADGAGGGDGAAAPSRVDLRRSSSVVGVSFQTPSLAGPPQYSRGEWNALQACLVAAIRGPAMLDRTVVEVSSALASSDRFDEAIDLLCLVRREFEACLMLQQKGRWREAAVLAITADSWDDLPSEGGGTAQRPWRASPKQRRVLRMWADHLVASGKREAAVELLLSIGAYVHAAVLLSEVDATLLDGAFLLDAAAARGVALDDDGSPLPVTAAEPDSGGSRLEANSVFVSGSSGSLRVPDGDTDSFVAVRRIATVNVARYLQALDDAAGAESYLAERAR